MFNLSPAAKTTVVPEFNPVFALTAGSIFASQKISMGLWHLSTDGTSSKRIKQKFETMEGTKFQIKIQAGTSLLLTHGRPDSFYKVPTAVALFPREAQFPREWAERSLNVQRFTRMPKGGHFAALEVPELYVKDLRESSESSQSFRVMFQ